MASKIVLPAVALLVAFAFGSGDALQCYECMSVGSASDTCNLEIITKDNNAKTTCSPSTMNNWHNKLAEHTTLNSIASVFEVNVNNGQPTRDVPMSCLKINLKVDNQPVTLRTCQDSNTSVDPCETIKGKILRKNSNHATVQYCDLCEGDFCNGSYHLSPTMILSIVPLIGSILMSLVYNSA